MERTVLDYKQTSPRLVLYCRCNCMHWLMFAALHFHGNTLLWVRTGRCEVWDHARATEGLLPLSGGPEVLDL